MSLDRLLSPSGGKATVGSERGSSLDRGQEALDHRVHLLGHLKLMEVASPDGHPGELRHFVPPGAAVLLRVAVGSTQRQALAPISRAIEPDSLFSASFFETSCGILARSFSLAASTSLVSTSCC